ncbi:hypothetical protein MRB53_009467 [Persea americana]|uniref:Uncharacterized protein n=1 Tax=Persea americana TaxID=3435 RepID=A0ACC2LP91_PERAE|nr:hypothetical protein MRB53_009467 [Persea americana]
MMGRGEMGAWEEDDGDNGGVLREGNEWREEGWRAMVLEMGSLGSAAWDHVLPLFWVFSTVGTRGPMISNAQVEKGHGAVVGCREDAGA